MDAMDGLRDILSKVNRRKPRCPAIDELPPEGRDANFDPGGEGSADLGKSDDLPIDELLPNPYNRKLDKDKVERIKTAIKETKEVYPIVYSEIDNEGKKGKMVIDGHHRYQALKELKYKMVPAVISDKRGTETKAPKEEVEKSRVRRKYRIGQRVRFFLPRDGVFEEGKIVTSRAGGRYQVRSEFNGRNHLIDWRSLRPL